MPGKITLCFSIEDHQTQVSIEDYARKSGDYVTHLQGIVIQSMHSLKNKKGVSNFTKKEIIDYVIHEHEGVKYVKSKLGKVDDLTPENIDIALENLANKGYIDRYIPCINLYHEGM